jgi:hypothetical protein
MSATFDHQLPVSDRLDHEALDNQASEAAPTPETARDLGCRIAVWDVFRIYKRSRSARVVLLILKHHGPTSDQGLHRWARLLGFNPATLIRWRRRLQREAHIKLGRTVRRAGRTIRLWTLSKN